MNWFVKAGSPDQQDTPHHTRKPQPLSKLPRHVTVASVEAVGSAMLLIACSMAVSRAEAPPSASAGLE